MAYSNFELRDLQSKFGISNKMQPLFENITPVALSEWLTTTLNKAKSLPNRSEKAKSESIVFPILLEMRDRNNQFFTIYSGHMLNADEAQGLNGECDFILAKDTQSFDLNYPIIQVVEAKKNDLGLGIPQCAAQLVGAQVFNQKNSDQPAQTTVFGCVTTGDEWQFMKLENKQILIDTKRYYLNELPVILGVLQQIIDFYKTK